MAADRKTCGEKRLLLLLLLLLQLPCSGWCCPRPPTGVISMQPLSAQTSSFQPGASAVDHVAGEIARVGGEGRAAAETSHNTELRQHVFFWLFFSYLTCTCLIYAHLRRWPKRTAPKGPGGTPSQIRPKPRFETHGHERPLNRVLMWHGREMICEHFVLLNCWSMDP